VSITLQLLSNHCTWFTNDKFLQLAATKLHIHSNDDDNPVLYPVCVSSVRRGAIEDIEDATKNTQDALPIHY